MRSKPLKKFATATISAINKTRRVDLFAKRKERKRVEMAAKVVSHVEQV